MKKYSAVNAAGFSSLYLFHPHKEKFFERLSIQMNPIEIQIGSGEFRQQIIKGVSEKDIRASREPGLSQYKEMRKIFVV